MIGHDDVSFVPGYCILGMATIGMPPFSSSGYWYEVDDGNLDSEWKEITPTIAFVVYKGEQNGS